MTYKRHDMHNPANPRKVTNVAQPSKIARTESPPRSPSQTTFQMLLRLKEQAAIGTLGAKIAQAFEARTQHRNQSQQTAQ